MEAEETLPSVEEGLDRLLADDGSIIKEGLEHLLARSGNRSACRGKPCCVAVADACWHAFGRKPAHGIWRRAYRTRGEVAELLRPYEVPGAVDVSRRRGNVTVWAVSYSRGDGTVANFVTIIVTVTNIKGDGQLYDIAVVQLNGGIFTHSLASVSSR